MKPSSYLQFLWPMVLSVGWFHTDPMAGSSGQDQGHEVIDHR